MRFRTGGRNWEGREWYLAPSLVVLAKQIEAEQPDPQSGDGTVASKRHDEVSPSSDHRPRPFTGRGIVRAIDVGEAQDADPMVAALVESRDPRIAYIIYERTIWRSYPKPGIDPWTPAPYTGPAPHSGHFHLSTLRTSVADNDESPWAIVGDDMALTEEDIRRIWAFPTLTEGVSAQLALTRAERGINALLLRDTTDPVKLADLILEGLDDDLARQVVDEIKQRL